MTMWWFGAIAQFAATGVLIWAIIRQVQWTRRLEAEYKRMTESDIEHTKLMKEMTDDLIGALRKDPAGEITAQLRKDFGETS